MIVPTFSGLVRALAGSLLARSVGGSRAVATGRSGRTPIVRVLVRFGSSKSRLHRTSNSASVAASAGLTKDASVSSAMASEIFCPVALR